MSKTYEIRHVEDLLQLTPEEFVRMLPDLAVWHDLTRHIHGLHGCKVTAFRWTDDGAIGITSVRMTDPATGEVTEVKL